MRVRVSVGLEKMEKGWDIITYQGSYPPVVVIAPPGVQQQRANAWNDLPPSLNTPTHRQFTVVGGVPAKGERVTYGS